MARLFTPKIARYYEEFYESKGVNFIKGTILTSFEVDSAGMVSLSVYALNMGKSNIWSYFYC